MPRTPDLPELPKRLWAACSMEPEGKVVASGVGAAMEIGDRFVVEANGLTIVMVCVHRQWPDHTWEAVDAVSFDAVDYPSDQGERP